MLLHQCALRSVLMVLLAPLIVCPHHVAAQESETAANAAEADSDQETRSLSYKFSKGQSIQYHVQHNMTILTQFPQFQAENQNDVTEQKAVRVVEIDEHGNATLEMKFKRIKMSAKSSESDTVHSFDSDNPSDDDPPQFKEVRKTVDSDTHVQFRVTPLGQLISVVRVDDAGNTQPIEPPPAKTGDPQVPQNDPSRNFLVSLPAEPVYVGASWKEDLTVIVNVTREIKRTVKLLRTYRVKSFEGSIVTLTMATSIAQPIKQPELLGQLIQRTPSGVIKFDSEAGQLVSRTTTVDKAVVNALGPNSMMKAVSKRVETMRPAEIASAQDNNSEKN